MVLAADTSEPLRGPEKQLLAEIHGLTAELDFHADRMGPFHPQTIAVAHRLSIALWCAGEINSAIGILDQALNGLASSPEPDHPVRLDLLCTLAEIAAEQGHLEQAGAIYREVLELCVGRSGANHPSSLAAKADLSLVLFELGETEEAARLEEEAYRNARLHLGPTHSVTSVLAWNRALRYESGGDLEAARLLVVDELAWLLTQADDALAADQKTIRAMLAKRLDWDSARSC